MKTLRPSDLELALVPKQVQMFSSVHDAIASDLSLKAERRRDLCSALRRLAAALERTMERTPADPGWLQPRIEQISPASRDLTPKTWANIVSDAKAALRQVGIVSRKIHRAKDLSPVWRELLESVTASGEKSLRIGVAPFIFFLDEVEALPEDVGIEHADAFRSALELNEIRRNPKTAYSNAIAAWNAAPKRISGWPGKPIIRPESANAIKLPLETFPQSFREELAQLPVSFAKVNFLARRTLRPYSQRTITLYSRYVERFAGALVRAGQDPASLTRLSDLIDPGTVQTGLTWLYERSGEVTTSLEMMADSLVALAERHCLVDDDHQAELRRLRARVTKKRATGMTPRNRERLRNLTPKKTRHRLISLPEQLFDEAGAKTTKSACLARETALVVALLSYTAIRRQNLVSIDIDHHLKRPGDGKTYLSFEPGEMKNSQALEYVLPSHLVSMIEKHLLLRSPTLVPSGTRWLFPRRDGTGPLAADYLAKRVTARIFRETGVKMHLHLFRHFAVYLYLEKYPGDYEGARRLMGHASLSTTLTAYSDLDGFAICQLFGDILDAERHAGQDEVAH
ncbi:site-specific integrase [Litorisediminicola beolgyonensis]|uniref:Tyrosine recombinase XerC n=1 Tax=Litorisediminicola beolgyonensis TaxID=1173614 RepID=A0ABW3ZNN3_9RHOB